MDTKKKHSAHGFGSRWGFILASVGSAVGMANVWGFPNKMGSNGGGAFLLIYLLFVFIFSYVGLPAEFAIGRRARTGTLGAYENAWKTRGEKAGKAGGLLAWLPLAGSMCIAIGYAVIVSYVLKALVNSLTGSLMTADAAQWFQSFSTTPYSVVPYHIIVVAITLLTLFFGAKSIEKTNKIMMPLFFVLFLVLAVRVAMLSGSAEGYLFMFIPRWESLKDPMVWIWAMGQAFFSLSVTGSGMIVYGAYLGEKEDVVAVSQKTALFDTIAAVVAALVIIPACFSYGMDVGAGPGLLFERRGGARRERSGYVRGRGGVPAPQVPQAQPRRCSLPAGRDLPGLRPGHGAHLQVGPLDGHRLHLHHPHRRHPGRSLLVLGHEAGGPAAGDQPGHHRKAWPPVVLRGPLCLRPLCRHSLLRGPV